MSDFSIVSDAIQDGEEIPRIHGYKNGNKEPDIGFSGVPPRTKSIAFVMDDPDAMAAVGKVWVHWVMCNIPWAQSLGTKLVYPEDVQDLLSNIWTAIVNGENDFGEIGYGGPAPPDGRHTYVFKAYALDTELELGTGFSKQELEDAMESHIIAEAKLTGTYAP
jgi:Raf kinase inhibitor-like YbhB/YbcL family protein